MLSLLVTLATLAALTLTGDRRQIVGANDNHIFKIVQSAHYVMREVLFDPYSAENIIFHLKPSYRDIQPPLFTEYIVTARSCAQLHSSPLQQHGLSAASLGHSAAQVATDSDPSAVLR